MRSARLTTVALVAACLACGAAYADVKLPALIANNMVLQRGTEVAVWGTADPGEKVTVKLAAQEVTATANEGGNWKLNLAAMEAGGPFEMTIAGKNTLTLTNVMVGEVWVCSGQSNMAFTLTSARDAQQEIAAADYPQIRLFTTRRVVSDKPLSDTQGRWAPCSPQTAGSFSAVGYFFGRALHAALKVPVGLIDSSWGGTAAEAWTSMPTLTAEPELKPILDRWDKYVADFPQAMETYNTKTLANWTAACEKAKAEGKPLPNKPNLPPGPASPNRPANLYNGMIAPLVSYAIKGAIWYQGESNAGRAYQYRKLFPTMIQDWRKAWGRGDFTFLFVQLANYMDQVPEPAESAWAELREAQTMTLSLPNTGMAVIIDIGEAKDIHPKNKQDVGWRLSVAALAVAYGQKDTVYFGPTYDSMAVEGDKVRLRFKHADGGLVAKGGGALTGFAVAGEDKKFKWAQAAIEGDTIVVSAADIAAPVAVRYAWANNPVCNLYNGAGLPASPFRTDDWPGTTINNK